MRPRRRPRWYDAGDRDRHARDCEVVVYDLVSIRRCLRGYVLQSCTSSRRLSMKSRVEDHSELSE
jgi:hypothetical protein